MLGQRERLGLVCLLSTRHRCISGILDIVVNRGLDYARILAEDYIQHCRELIIHFERRGDAAMVDQYRHRMAAMQVALAKREKDVIKRPFEVDRQFVEAIARGTVVFVPEKGDPSVHKAVADQILKETVGMQHVRYWIHQTVDGYRIIWEKDRTAK